MPVASTVNPSSPQNSSFGAQPYRPQHRGLLLPAVLIVLAAAVVFTIGLAFTGAFVYCNGIYVDAVHCVRDHQYEAAQSKLTQLPNFFKDASKLMVYAQASNMIEDKQTPGAVKLFQSLGAYRDAARQASYYQAVLDYDAKKFDEAGDAFDTLGDYQDSSKYGVLCSAHRLMDKPDENYNVMKMVYQQLIDLGDFKDSIDVVFSDTFIFYFLEGKWSIPGEDGFLNISYDQTSARWFAGSLANGSDVKISGAIMYVQKDGKWNEIMEMKYSSNKAVKITLYMADSSNHPEYTMTRK